ncbi:MAG: potassium channel protein [Chloroflexota bacterium]
MSYQGLLPRGLVVGLGLFAAIVAAGIVGFLIAGLSPVDAVLTTVSAVLTVGYAPAGPLSSGAKVFATVLILSGVGTGVYVIGSLTEFLVEGGLRGSWQQRRMVRQMEELRDHFIISGFGRVGQQAATQLENSGIPFIVVDANPSTIAVARNRGLLYYEGDATKNSILEIVGLSRARGLLACADSDVNNVYVTLSARALNADLYIVARAAGYDAEQNLYNAGASRVVSPYTMAGNRMAHLAVQPLAADYIDVVIHGQDLGVQIEERVIPAGSPLVNRTVGDVRKRELAGGHVLAVEHDGELITFVEDDLVIAAADRILVAGTAAQLEHFDATVT